MDKDIDKLAHTSWNCKYHIVFAPKYRRQILYKDKNTEIGKIHRQLCQWKEVQILEAEICPDHIHMLLKIPPKISVAGFMGYIRGKSSLLIYERWKNMQYKYKNREFGCRGYYVDTVGKNKVKVSEYIKTQLREDKLGAQLPFDKSPEKGNKRK